MQWFLCLLAQSQETLLSFGYLFMLPRSLKLRKARGKPHLQWLYYCYHGTSVTLTPAGVKSGDFAALVI